MRTNVRTIALFAAACSGIGPAAMGQPTISTAHDGNDKFPLITWTVVVPADDPISSLHIKGPYAADILKTVEPAGWTWTGKNSPADSGQYEWQTKGNVSGTFTFSIQMAAHSPLADKASIVQYDVLETDNEGETWRYYYDFSKPGTPNAGNWAFVPVPTPGTLALLGAAGLTAASRRR
ncbi:MAG: PEP-CTERM sorting domain-containing protein [Phycisphaerales bacterium]|nr:PEP-CTERM sorting domain-containing protein [Phycisphaerales bacterium]